MTYITYHICSAQYVMLVIATYQEERILEGVAFPWASLGVGGRHDNAV